MNKIKMESSKSFSWVNIGFYKNFPNVFSNILTPFHNFMDAEESLQNNFFLLKFLMSN